MPKSPSRTSKKKKYNARFPPARIKKIMQTDEDVGKVAAAVPVIISRALELFIESLIKETSETTLSKNAKTLSTSHIKQTIEGNKQFDFLRDLVANVPDHQTEDNNGDTAHYDGEPSSRKGRGRSRKQKDLTERGKKGGFSKAASDLSDDDEEDDDEDTETDEEGNFSSTVGTSYAPSASAVPYNAGRNLQDSHNSSTVSTSSISVPQIHITPPQIAPSSLPPPFTTPGMASLHNQQQQLQPFQQFHQEQSTQVQYPGSNRSPNPTQSYYPPFMPSSSQMLPSYPLPPQFANSYQQMMFTSSSQAPYQPAQHPGLHGFSNQHPNQNVHSQPLSSFQQKQQQQQEQASQPMNLSQSSPAPQNNNNDDYDS